MFTDTPASNDRPPSRSAPQNGTLILLPTLIALLFAFAPPGTQAQNCTYRIDGTLSVEHKTNYKNFLGTNRSDLAGVEVRVRGREIVLGGIGIWGKWKTMRTDNKGEFSVERTKNCSERDIQVQVRFKDPGLEIRNVTAKWYTVYQSRFKQGSGTDEDLDLTFSSSGNRALSSRVPWYHAEIWTLYQAAIDQMAGYGSRLAFQNTVVVNYPHNHISSEGVSYANPVTKVIALVKNSSVGHDGGKNPEVALHELMHIWAYQHTRNEGLVGTYFIGQTIKDLIKIGDGELVHGVLNETYVAFHEGFAEWAAEFLKPRIGPQSRTDPWSPSFLRDYSNGITSFSTIEFADRGWYNVFSLMQAPRPWELNFNTGQNHLSRTNTTASDIFPFKNCQVGQLDFSELLNVVDRKGQQDISTGNMNWSDFTNIVASRSNGVGQRDIQAYRTMLDPTSSRQEILRSMCAEGEVHTVVIKSKNISGGTKFTVEASRAVKQVEGSLEGHSVSIQSGDEDSGATATGAVSAGADGFKVADGIEEITLDTPDAATVYVDGKEYHTVVIASGGASGRTDYTVKASDDLTQVGGTLDGENVTIDRPDNVSGATADGRVSSGADGFTVTGTIQEIRLNNPEAATVYVDDGGPLGGGAPMQVYATRPVSGDGNVGFGKTGTEVQFRGTSGSATVGVTKLGDGPDGTDGIPDANVSDYRFVIGTVGNLSVGSNTEVRLDVGTLGGVGNAANVTVYKRSTEGTGSFSPLATVVDAGQNELVATTGSFSEFVLGSDSEPLPVEMTSFDATSRDDRVRLRWATASESNNAGFEIQRSSAEPDGGERTWTEVGFVESKAEGGTSSEAQTYRFTDTDLPYEADTLEYRLRQVDVGGTATLSDPVAVARGGPSGLRLKETYPNPTSGRVTVRFAVPDEAASEGTVRLRLYDMLGRAVRTAAPGAEAGRHERHLDVQGLASGTYLLRLEAGGQQVTRKLTVVQ